MTTTREACDAIRSHHEALGEQLTVLVTALSESVAAQRPHAAQVAELVTYLAEQILPHAAAEEQTIYPAAAARPELTDIVREMIAEHQVLSSAAERLAGTAAGPEALDEAMQIAALFEAHVAKENDVLLPALAADAATDLPALLAEMHRRSEHTGPVDVGLAGLHGTDPLAAVLSLLLAGTTALARAGQADLACRLTASAWAEVHATRPDLAVKLTAVLHGLGRRAADAGQPASASGQPGGPAEAGPELDVRDLAPAQRHESIFAAYHNLAPGASFVLVNDHDPKPLRYQFEAEHAGQFSWDSLQAGPHEWRVRIGRPQANTRSPGSEGRSAGGVADAAGPELDVRTIPHRQRHETIFATFLTLPPGDGFVLVNDHDPVPLRYQFEAQYPDAFSWQYVESGPQLWRVRIGRTAA